MEMLAAWPLRIAAFAWGAIWGSFANVVIVRWPKDESIVRPASHCPRCRAPIRAYDNVPIVSYLVLGGRCRSCRAPISILYPVVEILLALIATAICERFVVGAFGPPSLRAVRFFAYFFFAWGLVTLSVIDLAHMLIPDVITLTGAGLGLFVAALLPETLLLDSAIGAAAGYLGVELLFVRGYRALTGRAGMGSGDAKLLAMVGALLGWRGVLFTVLAGAIQGLPVGVATALRRAARVTEHPESGEGASSPTRVPFGPFLSLAALEYLFFGELILDWYWGLLGG